MLDLLLFLALIFGHDNCRDIAIGRQGNKQAIFEKFDNTCGIRNPVLVFKYSGIRIEGNKMYLNCTLTANEDIPEDPQMVIRIERCKSKENLDSCEPFHSLHARYCGTTATFAKDFVNSFEPQWKCPIEKGVYTIKNGEIDVMAFFMFPMESYHWKAIINILEKNTDRVLMCVIAQLYLKRV